MALDKINALSGPPGHSLTDTPKKWAWEKPPMYSDPNEAIDHIVSGLENKSTRNDMVKMMFAGISVEELVTQISFKGFMEGAFTPDVAELIKPSIAIYLLGVAEDEGFVPKMYSKQSDSPEADDQVTDDTMFSIMQQRNPEMFAAMLEQENEEQRMLNSLHEQDSVDMENEIIEEEQLSNSFMRTPDSVIMDAELEEEEPIEEERVV